MSNIKREIANEMHRAARKNFQRRKFKVLRPYEYLQADLVEMRPYAKDNNGYNYLLTVIDCFSKKAWAAPVKDKTGEQVTKAMETILYSMPQSVKNLQTDEGKEFFNKQFDSLMKKFNINHYHTFTHIKAGIVERFNRTLKNWMWREFSIQGNYKWLDLIEKLLNRYNSKVHRSTGIAPKKVTNKNQNLIYNRLMLTNKNVKVKPQFNVDDVVRISKYKHVFSKGYNPSWTGELFTIYKVKDTSPVTYILKDERGEIIEGGFYEYELLRTKHKDVYLIEKVIKRKDNKLYVKWLGFSNAYNSWIDIKDLIS